jgi:hypothetical protein
VVDDPRGEIVDLDLNVVGLVFIADINISEERPRGAIVGVDAHLLGDRNTCSSAVGV